jgi:hypothetical protein
VVIGVGVEKQKDSVGWQFFLHAYLPRYCAGRILATNGRLLFVRSRVDRPHDFALGRIRQVRLAKDNSQFAGLDFT